MSHAPKARARQFAILAGVAVALLVSLAWWRLSGDPGAPASVAVTAATTPGTDTTASPPPSPSDLVAPAAVSTDDALPLPAADVPFDRIVDDLQRRADAGDRAAACRLGFELMRCRHLLASAAAVNAMSEHESAMESQGVDGFEGADTAAQDQIRLIQRGAACKGIDPTLLARGGDYLERAARAGHAEAMLRYAQGEGLPPHPRNRPVDFALLRDPAFLRWRRDAAAMLQQAFAAGNVAAAFQYPEALAGGPQWNPIDAFRLEGVVVDDPVAHAAHRLLIQRLNNLGPEFESRALESLDAEQRQRARADSERWHRDYFDGRRLGLDDVVGLARVDSPWQADRLGVIPCEEAR